MVSLFDPERTLQAAYAAPSATLPEKMNAGWWNERAKS
jgi:hypothetical protein